MARTRYAPNREFYLALGQRIAAMRRGRLTQEQLARKIGITRTSVINIEKGRQQVLVHTLVGIAGALDIPPGALIPSHDDFSVRLKDATKKGRDWILTTIASLEEK